MDAPLQIGLDGQEPETERERRDTWLIVNLCEWVRYLKYTRARVRVLPPSVRAQCNNSNPFQPHPKILKLQNRAPSPSIFDRQHISRRLTSPGSSSWRSHGSQVMEDDCCCSIIISFLLRFWSSSSCSRRCSWAILWRSCCGRCCCRCDCRSSWYRYNRFYIKQNNFWTVLKSLVYGAI